MARQALKPFIFGLIVIFLGSFVVTFFNIYNAFPQLDKLFHVTGGFILAWFFSQIWANELKLLNFFQRLVIYMGVAVLIGVFWEIMEFSTSLPPLYNNQILRHYIYGGSLADTLADLMADILGAGIFGLLWLNFKIFNTTENRK